MNDIRSVESTARPLRVAYLIDIENCPHKLLDDIFAECYSRWGGRRTLIIPSNKDTGIQEEYEEWLFVYDPDIIYSYVDLTDSVVIAMHETYCPLFIKKHPNLNLKQSISASYHPHLPLSGICCLSLFPFLIDRKGLDNFQNSKILDCVPDIQPPRYVSDNYGTFYRSISGTHLIDKFPELYKTVTLASEKYVSNRAIHKKENSEYLLDYNDFLSKIADPKESVLTLSMLSDFLTWKLNFNSQNEANSFNLVIGDTEQDRLLFWNFYQHYSTVYNKEVVSLIVSPKDLEGQKFFQHIVEVIKKRSQRSHVGYPITVRSFSVSEEILNGYVETLTEAIPHASVKYKRLTDHEEIIPNTRSHFGLVDYSPGDIWNEPKSRSKKNYTNNLVEIPVALPIHMKDVRVPPSLRTGVWMLDIVIQRQISHSKYVNVSHIWLLPRRLRIDKILSRVDDYKMQDIDLINIRTNRNSLPSIPIKYDQQQPALELPDDLNAIANSIVSKHEWTPFDSSVVNPVSYREKFDDVVISDKGRYFQGFMHNFSSLSEAGQVLFHVFWHKVFSEFGASEGYITESAILKVSKRIERRLQNSGGEDFLKDEASRHDFSKRCLSIAVNVAREKKFISWKRMCEIWEECWENFIEKNPQFLSSANEMKDEDFQSLEHSTQFLCQKNLLFQGQNWSCKACNHKNWISIENLKSTLICEICGNEKPASISSEWKFRINEFILDAMRQHGTNALVWSLIRLFNRAENSFYYLPSVRLQLDNASLEDQEWSEIDLIAIVDGEFYACEIKSSSKISDRELDTFIKIMNRLRPNVALIAVMETNVSAPEFFTDRIGDRLDKGIKLEILTLKEGDFDDNPNLPFGNLFRYKYF